MKKIKFKNLDLFLVMCILIMVFYQFSCQKPVYEKNETSSIQIKSYQKNIQIKIEENEAYEKSYLNPNGLYSAIKYEKLSFIPDSIISFSKLNGARKNDLIAYWAIFSNFGEYNFANNPFGISNLEVKELEKKSSILGSKYVYVDSTNSFIQTRVRFQSFENLQKAFETFYENKDKFNMSPKMKQTFVDIKHSLDSIEFKEKIDSNKLRIFGADTIHSNDSLKIVNLIKNIDYKRTIEINTILIILVTITLYRLLSKN